MDARALGRDIKRRRLELDLTQKTLADRAGISQQHLSLLETNPEGAQLRTLARVLEVLDLSLGVMSAAAEAARRRQAAWMRMNRAEAALPGWGEPASDLARVGELAVLYRRLHGPAASDDEPPSARLAFRRRLALLAVR